MKKMRYVAVKAVLFLLTSLCALKNTLSFQNVYDISLKTRSMRRMPSIQSTSSGPGSEQSNMKESLSAAIKTAATLGTTAVIAGGVIGSDARMVRAEENVCRLNELMLPELKYSYNGNDNTCLLLILYIYLYTFLLNTNHD